MSRRFSLLGRDLAVDYGTSRLRVHAPGTGPVFDVPSAVTYHTGTGRILAYGDEAIRMYGRTPPGVLTVRPLKEGAVADFEVARWLLSRALAAATGSSSRLNRPRLVLVSPQGASDLVRKALAETAIQAGAREVRLVDSALAAAVGAGLPIDEPRGTMLIDIGAGTSEIAILALGEVLQAHSARFAGDAFDTAVVEHFRRGHGIGLSRTAAEALKINVGLVPVHGSVRVNGRHLRSGLPVTQEFPAGEVAEALQRPARALLDTIGKALDACPAELAQDLTERGIHLTGRGAQLIGLAEQVRRAMGIPVHTVDSPGTATARGAAEFAAAFGKEPKVSCSS